MLIYYWFMVGMIVFSAVVNLCNALFVEKATGKKSGAFIGTIIGLIITVPFYVQIYPALEYLK